MKVVGHTNLYMVANKIFTFSHKTRYIRFRPDEEDDYDETSDAIVPNKTIREADSA